jgi:hypothetical protein
MESCTQDIKPLKVIPRGKISLADFLDLAESTEIDIDQYSAEIE